MTPNISNFLNMYVWPSGRAMFATRQVVKKADELGDNDIKARAETAYAAARKAREAEMAFRKSTGRPAYGPRAAELDASVDRILGSIDGHLEVQAKMEALSGDVSAFSGATALRAALFPSGAAALTRLSYGEEYDSVTIVLDQLKPGGKHAEAAQRHGLTPFVQRLDAVNAEFGAEIEVRPEAPKPTFDTIRALRAEANAALQRLIAAMIGKYPDDDDDSVQRATALFEPIVFQQDQIARANKSRRSVTDIDPETGEVEEPIVTE
jgi:hypothetical protein